MTIANLEDTGTEKPRNAWKLSVWGETTEQSEGQNHLQFAGKPTPLRPKRNANYKTCTQVYVEQI